MTYLNKSKQTFLFVLFALCFYSLGGFAQLKFQHLTINEGLSQNTVYAILQDSRGYVWMGTEDGLNRYDGYEFVSYKHEPDNPASLSHSQVNALLEDAVGNLFIGTANGLCQYNRQTGRFIRLTEKDSPLFRANFITSIVADKPGHFWVGMYQGLREYTVKNNKLAQVKVYENWEPKRVQSLLKDGQNVLWIGTSTGIQKFNTGTKKYEQIPAELNKTLGGKNVRVIRKDRQDNFWIGTENSGLYRFSPKSKTIQNYLAEKNASSLPSNIIRDLFIADDNHIWVGTREGLSILNPDDGKFTSYQYDLYNPYSLSHNSIRCFMKDQTGDIWLGTYAGGVNVFHKASVNFVSIGERIGKKTGFNHRVVSAILTDKQENYWVGTEGGGLNFMDAGMKSTMAYPVNDPANPSSGNIVKSLVFDGEKHLWIGTYDGLKLFDISKKRFIANGLDTPTAAKLKQVYVLLKRGNTLWVGTNGNGLFAIENGQIKQAFKMEQGDGQSLSSNNITSLARDEIGNLWVGTQNGLNLIKNNSRRVVRLMHQPQKNSLLSNSIHALFIDQNKRLWVGTQDGGLQFYQPKTGRFFTLGAGAGLQHKIIQAIQDDEKGNLWLSTNSGLSQIRFERFVVPFRAKDLKVLDYTVTDGLQSNQFSTGAAGRAKKGFCFFGGINGITLFNPGKMLRNQTKPNIALTDLLVKNKPVNPGGSKAILQKTINETKNIELNYDQAYITFKYAALNFINPEKNRYAYRLDGLDNDDGWHQVGNQRTATYTNLSPGDYTFSVIAANNDGVWNLSPRSVYIHIYPPWYKTILAYTVYLFIICGLLYLFYYYSIKTARLKDELVFEHLSHEKDLELNHRKLNFFTNISHEIKTPLTLILGPVEKMLSMNQSNNKVQNQLMLMQRNGERLSRLINQLLDFRKFESGKMKMQVAEGNLSRFLQEVFIAFENYAQDKHISFRLEKPEQDVVLFYDYDKLEKILYNLLSNALKFTQTGGTVALRLVKLVDGVRIDVEDNGPGIECGLAERVFEPFNSASKQTANGTGIGLAFTKNLVELHKGKISVESRFETATEKGHTCFFVFLKEGSSHFEPEDIVAKNPDAESVVSYRRLQKSPAPENLQPEISTEKPILLIVEDNADVLGFIASGFEDLYNVHTANNGEEGWEKALKLIPDLVISDVMMPVMNGIEFCRKLKTDVRTSHIPVILLTARTPVVHKIEGLETGADDYITKPFSIRVLESRVKNLIELREKLRSRYQKEITLQPVNTAITSPDEKFLTKVMDFIDKNMDNTLLSVEELGNEIGMSRVTLYRKIKALTNQTAIEFIRSVRLKRAAQLLVQNKLHVNEVAYMVGFQDVDYFRKCFKEQFGFTPKEYAASNSLKNV